MSHDVPVGLSPDGWLPDRISIGVLTRAFPPEVVDGVIRVTGTQEQRRRLLPARLVVYFTLALWLFRGQNCGYRQVMLKLADGLYRQRGRELLADSLAPKGVNAGQGGQWRVPNASSLSRARVRLGSDPLRMLFEHVAGAAAPGGAEGVWCCGLRVVSVDGTTTDVPDDEENAEFFGRPPNGTFPQARWVVAAESGTGSLLGAAIGRYRDGAQSLALGLLRCLGPGMLVLADRAFLSWSLAHAVLATGSRILWRAPAAFSLSPARALADGTYLAEWRPPGKDDGPVIAVRVIEYVVHAASQDGTEKPSELFCLVTDLLDPEEYPALDLAVAYEVRWGCRSVISRYETDMGEGQPVLRSGYPEGAMQELWALFAVHQALCVVVGLGGDATGIPSGRISFPPAL